jgi:cell division protein FtsL
MKLTRARKKMIFYLVIYTIIVLCALIGLVYNIKTDKFNVEILKLKQQSEGLAQENRRLELFVLEETRLEKIEQKALELGMVKVKKIKYITVTRYAQN